MPYKANPIQYKVHTVVWEGSHFVKFWENCLHKKLEQPKVQMPHCTHFWGRHFLGKASIIQF